MGMGAGKGSRCRAGIYIHVPFCVRKCGYCDFLSAPADEAAKARYHRALLREIAGLSDSRGGGEIVVPTVFFGGGTPSLFSGRQIMELLEALRDPAGRFRVSGDAEITMEANPGTVTPESLSAYRHAGVNRLSLGLQTADDRELRLLGRIHTFGEFHENFLAARAAGFSNINVDLMSALPGQTLASWEETLEKVLRLEPEHISAYSLIIEEGTLFYEWYGPGAKGREGGQDAPEPGGRERHPHAPLPDEEAERQMYVRTKEILERAGYARYEISNYAKPGYECRHNLSYWKRLPYLGLGLGASSFFGETRWRNEDNLTEYLHVLEAGKLPQEAASLRREAEQLSRADQIAETMFLGLRMAEGVKEQEFTTRFGQTPEEVYGQLLAKQERLGLIHRKDGYIRLTNYGIDVSNQVFCEYLL